MSLCFLVLNWTGMMGKETYAIYRKPLLPLRKMEPMLPSTRRGKASYPVKTVWRQILGPFLCHSSVLGVCPPSLCLQKRPLRARVNGKSCRRLWTRRMAPSGGCHSGRTETRLGVSVHLGCVMARGHHLIPLASPQGVTPHHGIQHGPCSVTTSYKIGSFPFYR